MQVGLKYNRLHPYKRKAEQDFCDTRKRGCEVRKLKVLALQTGVMWPQVKTVSSQQEKLEEAKSYSLEG